MLTIFVGNQYFFATNHTYVLNYDCGLDSIKERPSAYFEGIVPHLNPFRFHLSKFKAGNSFCVLVWPPPNEIKDLLWNDETMKPQERKIKKLPLFWSFLSASPLLTREIKVTVCHASRISNNSPGGEPTAFINFLWKRRTLDWATVPQRNLFL